MRIPHLIVNHDRARHVKEEQSSKMEIDEDVKAFLVESNENLNQLEGDLVALEQNPADQELLNRIYRALHTLKGNCGFLGLEKLQSVAHAAENLLSFLRDRALTVNPEIASALLQVIDAVRQILTTLEGTGSEGDRDDTALVETLQQLQGGNPPVAETESTTEILPHAPSPLPEVHTATVADSSIRVDVNLLDKLMNLVGELVLCRNQLVEFAAQQQAASRQTDSKFVATSQRLNQVTAELQEGVMKTRMQPIRTIWSKFPRLVRDLSVNLGKQIQLEMEGEDTELDKTLIEAIADPLIHLVRNCVDHGIEQPEVRTALGKLATGRLFLRAFHESGHVNIEISDDGAGIDSNRIKEKALERGLIGAEKANQMGDQEAQNLIFLPGLSTATRVSNLSGRGVGMDVVRTNIEKINGTVDVYSPAPSRGTTFKLKIPLTLAIIPTLIVTSKSNGPGGIQYDRYAIPQVNLLELVRLEGSQARRGIEMVHRAPVYRLRGRLLPLVDLNRELNLEVSPQEEDRDTLNIVVLQATDKPFGLVVDAINDTQEIVVKPLGKQLKGIPCFAGATIMGDGKVALILDVQGLAARAHVLSEAIGPTVAESKSQSQQESGGVASQQHRDRLMLLLFAGPDNRRMAISLSRVARLEDFPGRAIERTGLMDVIQYRNQILPLIYLSACFSSGSYLPMEATADDKIQVVVVHVNGEHMVGLVVDRILDIVEQEIEVKGAATQEEVLYSAVIQGRVTELIDVEAVIRNNLVGAMP
ncbi:MAG: chemotaxis protein CheA [Hormoscilla sp.]